VNVSGRAKTIERGGAGTLTDQVADALREEISRNILRPGEALLPEQKIADRYGVSRTVTREAIARLKAEGIVTVRQGVGIFVADEIPAKPFRIEGSIAGHVDRALAIIELRSGIEVKASELAAVRRQSADLVAMNDALNRIDAANEAGDITGSIDADIEFHKAIYSATGNTYYIDLFVFISQYFRKVVEHNRMNAPPGGDVRNQAQREHRAIFGAIIDQDVERTIAAVKLHIDNVAKRIHLAEFKWDASSP
jgi:GntR family transcriptional repressor for pyruvate dehydrogenase complex